MKKKQKNPALPFNKETCIIAHTSFIDCIVLSFENTHTHTCMKMLIHHMSLWQLKKKKLNCSNDVELKTKKKH